MERSDFYQALSAAPASYDWGVDGSNSITATVTRGKNKGQTFNPVTAVANYLGVGSYGSNKRETLKAGTAEIAGSSLDVIETTEDRELFQKLCESIGIDQPKSEIAFNEIELIQLAPFNDPMYLSVNGCRLSIRRDTAQYISICK